MATRVKNDVTPVISGVTDAESAAERLSVPKTSVAVIPKKSSNEDEVSMSTDEKIMGVAEGVSRGERTVGVTEGVARGERTVGVAEGVARGERTVGAAEGVARGERIGGAAEGVARGERIVGVAEGVARGENEREKLVKTEVTVGVTCSDDATVEAGSNKNGEVVAVGVKMSKSKLPEGTGVSARDVSREGETDSEAEDTSSLVTVAVVVGMLVKVGVAVGVKMSKSKLSEGTGVSARDVSREGETDSEAEDTSSLVMVAVVVGMLVKVGVSITEGMVKERGVAVVGEGVGVMTMPTPVVSTSMMTVVVINSTNVFSISSTSCDEVRGNSAAGDDVDVEGRDVAVRRNCPPLEGSDTPGTTLVRTSVTIAGVPLDVGAGWNGVG